MASQPMIASRCASVNADGRSAAAGTLAQRDVGAAARPTMPATTRVAPDWPISTTSTPRRRTSASVAVAVASARRPSASPAAQLVEQVPQRRAAAGRRRRGEDRRAGPVGRNSAVRPAARGRQAARQHRHEVRAALRRGRDDGAEVREERALVAHRADPRRPRAPP